MLGSFAYVSCSPAEQECTIHDRSTPIYFRHSCICRTCFKLTTASIRVMKGFLDSPGAYTWIRNTCSTWYNALQQTEQAPNGSDAVSWSRKKDRLPALYWICLKVTGAYAYASTLLYISFYMLHLRLELSYPLLCRSCRSASPKRRG